jgi:CBS domain-containing protein
MGLLKLATETAEVGPDTLVIDAVRTMTEKSVGSLAVMDGRRCVGIFTERDLVRRVVYKQMDPGATKVRDVMTSPVVTVTERTSIAHAAEVMREHRFRHLVIVDGRGEFVGMLALRYLLYALMDELEAKVGDLEGYLMADGPGG